MQLPRAMFGIDGLIDNDFLNVDSILQYPSRGFQYRTQSNACARRALVSN